jgi:hypothetical protein
LTRERTSKVLVLEFHNPSSGFYERGGMKATLYVSLVVAGAVAASTVTSAQNGRPAAAVPTFTKDVAPILYKNCTSCHRPGETAPMSLLTYSEARPYVRAIASAVTKGTMPPWHADPAHGQFLNDRRLNAADRETLLAWANGGAPEGNPADLPAAPVYPDGWSIGKPDAVFTLPEDYPVPASGTIDYKYFEVPTNFTEDKWVQAFEVKPGTPSVVHHVIIYSRPPRRPAPEGAQAQQQQQQQAGPRRQGPISFAPGMEEPDDVKANAAHQSTPNDRPAPKGGAGAFVAGFAPGQSVRVFQEGSALKVPAGSTLIFQMHYTASGKPATDRSKIAFVFAKEKPKYEAITAALMNQNFTLPAGSASTRVDAEMTINNPMTLWSLLPHTHVRGVKWEVEMTYPDGRKEIVLAVPKYDFNWQTDYVFKEPLKIPAGTKVRTSAWYDNSTANKSNPDPKADVHWGEQTFEEMQFTAFTFTLDPQPKPSTAQQQ